MKHKPLIVLSYSWLLHNHKDYTDEELATALYGTGAAIEHIKNDDNCDAQWARSDGGNPHARVKPFIMSAAAEGRFARVISKEDFNKFFGRFDVPPLGDDVGDACGFVYQGDMCAHLEGLGYRVAGACAKRNAR